MRVLAAWVLLVLLPGTPTDMRAGFQTSAPTSSPAADALNALKDEGAVIYNRECASCHGGDGTGDGAGPGLAGNRELANQAQVIKRILEGAADKGMDPFAGVLSDREVAAVATFVRNAWENAHGIVLEAEVKLARARVKTP